MCVCLEYSLDNVVNNLFRFHYLYENYENSPIRRARKLPVFWHLLKVFLFVNFFIKKKGFEDKCSILKIACNFS